MGFLLFLVSIILSAVLFAVSLVFTPVYYIITLKWGSGTRKLNAYFYQCAIGVDQLGNRLCSEVLNTTLLIQKDSDRPNWSGMLFGDIDETVSYVLGVNYYSDNLNKVGLIIVKILNKLESYHIQRALCMKYLNDIDAGVRLNGRFFYKLNNMQAEGDTELNKVIANILGPYSPVNESVIDRITIDKINKL